LKNQYSKEPKADLCPPIKPKRSFMMKKRILFIGMAVLLALSLAFLTGCPTEPEEEEENTTGLESWVYGGGTPQASNPGWLTITFKENNKVICAFSADNTTNEWTYTYDKETRAGAVAAPDGGWSPGAFSISTDHNTLTFTSYMGAAREFKRLRSTEGVIDPVPFTPGVLPADLVSTVWAGETPRSGDWATFTFKADNKAVASFAGDNTTNEWTYTYVDSSKSGSFSGGGLGAFTINENTQTLVITAYYAHGPREFKRLR
jgi:hypothetical protein